MNHYRRRRKHRKRKWAIVSVVLIIAVVKIYTRDSGPASTFCNENESVVSVSEPQIENSTALPAYKSVPKPKLCEIPDSTYKSNPELTAIINNVTACIDARPPRIIESRDKLNEILSIPISNRQFSFAKRQLSNLSAKWLFSRTVLPGDNLCSSYMVEPGDQFIILGKKFKVPYKILMQINNISNPKALRAGDTIKIINGPFHCRIYRSAFTMDLYLQDTFVQSFSVGLGKPGMETPTGRWVVKPDGKLISPTWTDPTTGKTYEAQDPDYPLGARWIGLEGVDGAARDRTGFAIHGTKNPEEIGTAGSRGCIRLRNDDVKLVYDLLMPGVSQVIVVE